MRVVEGCRSCCWTVGWCIVERAGRDVEVSRVKAGSARRIKWRERSNGGGFFSSRESIVYRPSMNSIKVQTPEGPSPRLSENF